MLEFTTNEIINICIVAFSLEHLQDLRYFGTVSVMKFYLKNLSIHVCTLLSRGVTQN